MKLGAFSVSLSVKDIHASKAFYEKLGFSKMGGNIDQNWVILRNGTSVIGLFQGMFEGNILTFNPGWDQQANEVNPYDDIRSIQQHLKKSGIVLIHEVDPSSEGPAHLTMQDPDGNNIMLDQHR